MYPVERSSRNSQKCVQTMFLTYMTVTRRHKLEIIKVICTLISALVCTTGKKEDHKVIYDIYGFYQNYFFPFSYFINLCILKGTE